MRILKQKQLKTRPNVPDNDCPCCVKLTLCKTLFETCELTAFKDKHIGEVLKSAGSTLTITVMPEFIYDHIVKKVSKGLFKQMDHSIPDV